MELIHANRGIFRFRCPILHKACVKLQYLDEINFQDIISLILKKDFKEIIYYKTLSCFLEFIYSDMIIDLNDLNEKETQQLIYFSEIFDLKRLKSILLESDESEDISIPPPTIQDDLYQLYTLAQELSTVQDLKSPNIPIASPVKISTFYQKSIDNLSSISSTSTNFSAPEYCYSDLIFEIGNEKIYTHKFIIESRLKNNFEKLQQEDFQNMNPNVFRVFLQYLYFDHQISIDFDISIELMILAEDYDLQRLSKMCQSVIEKKIHVFNVCKILQISDTYDIMHLRKFCIFYIIYHFSSIKRK
jgi:hypothetical protein